MLDDEFIDIPHRQVQRHVFDERPGHGFKGAPFVECVASVRLGSHGVMELRIEVLNAVTGNRCYHTMRADTAYLMSGGWLDAVIRELHHETQTALLRRGTGGQGESNGE